MADTISTIVIHTNSFSLENLVQMLDEVKKVILLPIPDDVSRYVDPSIQAIEQRITVCNEDRGKWRYKLEYYYHKGNSYPLLATHKEYSREEVQRL